MSNECTTTYEMKWPKIAVDKMRDVYSMNSIHDMAHVQQDSKS